MAFQKGHKLSTGRPLGSKNKVQFDLLEMLRENGFEPAAALVEKHNLAMEDFQRHERNRLKTQKRMNELREDDEAKFEVGMTDDARESLKVATAAASQLMQYVHPKRKAIEHTGAGGEPLTVKPVVVYIPDNGRKS